MRRRFPIRAVAGLLAALASGHVGCASGAARAPVGDGLRPSVVGDRDGLEVRWWVVEDRGQALATTLAPFADRAGAVRELRSDELRRSGLRLLAVTASEAEAVHAALPTVGADVRQWMGELTSWTEIVKGSPVMSRSAVRTGEGSMPIPPGRLRMLARCYRLPGSTPRMRLELAPQVERLDDLAADLRLALGEARGVEASGPLFQSLAVSWTAEPGMVYLLVPEAPNVDWRSVATAPRAESERDTGDGALGPEAWDGVGPEAPSTPTLGEALLGSPDTRPGIRGRRAIVVLAPIATDRRDLIPG